MARYQGPFRVTNVSNKVAQLEPIIIPNNSSSRRLQSTSAPFDRLRKCKESKFTEAAVPEPADPNLEREAVEDSDEEEVAILAQEGIDDGNR